MQAAPPPVPSLPSGAQGASDSSHLQLLTVGHYILAGLYLLVLLFLIVDYSLMTGVFGPMSMQMESDGFPFDPTIFFGIFYLVIGVPVLLLGFVNLIAAEQLRQRKGRVFTLVVAGLNCFNMPFGTLLGVFTFIVLMRSTVIQRYGEGPIAVSRSSKQVFSVVTGVSILLVGTVGFLGLKMRGKLGGLLKPGLAQTQLACIETALDSYHEDYEEFPKGGGETILMALQGGNPEGVHYLSAGNEVDPWQRGFLVLRRDAEGRPVFYSSGPNLQDEKGGGDDIVSQGPASPGEVGASHSGQQGP